MKIALLAFTSLFAVTSPRVFGLAGDLPEPLIAFPENWALREPVMAVLRAKEFRYLGGSFVNSVTKLRYGGDVKSLNTFLNRLGKIDGIKVSVVFSDQFDDGDWRVTHSAWSNPQIIGVMVNAAKIAETSVTIPKAKK